MAIQFRELVWTYQSLIEVNARKGVKGGQEVYGWYQSLIEVNARTTGCVLKSLYPQLLVKSSEQFVNKRT